MKKRVQKDVFCDILFIILIIIIIGFSIIVNVRIISAEDCIENINCDSVIDVRDLIIVAKSIGTTGCNLGNSWCDKKDVDNSGSVGLGDIINVAKRISTGCTPCSASCPGTACYYVNSASGSDSNNGNLTKPFKTIDKARQTIQGKNNTFVYLRGGTYYLSSTLQFSSSDSGKVGKPNVYISYPGERAVIKGSKNFSGGMFSPVAGKPNQYKLNLSGIISNNPTQLFMNGNRMILARYPNYNITDPIGRGWLFPASDTPNLSTQFKYNAGDINPSLWSHISDMSIFVFPEYNWWPFTIPVSSINSGTRLVTLSEDKGFNIVSNSRYISRYYFQNVYEELDSNNEWFWDKYNKILHIYSTTPLTNQNITVPVVNVMISFVSGNGASNIQLINLSFAESDNDLIDITDSYNILIDGANITNSKESGVQINRGENITIKNSDIYKTGSWGIMGYSDPNYFKQLKSSNYLFANNTVHETGVFRKGWYGGAIAVSPGIGTTISGNEIFNDPKQAIVVSGNDNVIEYNYIHDVNKEVEDAGAIDVYGGTWLYRGNIVRYNYINRTGGYGWNGSKWVSPYYSNGIYLDDLSSGVTIYGNTIDNANWNGVDVHSGRDNIIYNNTFINTEGRNGNILYESVGEWYGVLPIAYNEIVNMQANGYNRTKYFTRYPELQTILDQGNAYNNPALRYSIMYGNKAYNNIYFYPETNALVYKLVFMNYSSSVIDNNTIWAGNKSFLVNYNYYSYNENFNSWRAKGLDVHSKNVSDFYKARIINSDTYLILINREKTEKTYTLSQNYCDLKNNTVSGSVTLKTFESKILLSCYCNKDGVCNNRETSVTCSNDCGLPSINPFSKMIQNAVKLLKKVIK